MTKLLDQYYFMVFSVKMLKVSVFIKWMIITQSLNIEKVSLGVPVDLWRNSCVPMILHGPISCAPLFDSAWSACCIKFFAVWIRDPCLLLWPLDTFFILTGFVSTYLSTRFVRAILSCLWSYPISQRRMVT